ncbi:hypothetical protein J1614_000899 [Plenodomus biglobosus]|nr:hypothetical protein J1614_000899 [Plenodomus biglobosus]
MDGVTIEDRHKREQHFFETVSPWTSLKKDRVGIYALKAFLGNLLHKHISNEFPGVVKDIEELSVNMQKELELLGPSRQTTADQRRFLTRVANAYQHDVSGGLSGNYDPELSSDSPLKLRMHIGKLNDNFVEIMARKGHAKVFLTVEGKADQEYARSSNASGDILDWIRELYRDSRGAELLGTVNPVVLENMFRQQSRLWENIASIYLEKVRNVVRAFNTTTLERLILDGDLREKLKTTLSKGEQTTYSSVRKQLSLILKDERGGILQTVNHYFADTLSGIRQERVVARLEATGFYDGCGFDMNKVLKSVHLSNEDQAVNDIHDILKAYYKVALKRFTDNVVLQVTERYFLGPGGPVKALSPEMIGDLGDDVLMEVAGENFATSSARNELISKCERFQRALDIAKQAGV